MTARIAEATVNVSPGDYLADLLARRADLKRKADEANANYDAVKDAIKVELNLRNPGAAVIDIHDPFGGPALRLSWSPTSSFNRRKFERDHPDLAPIYVTPGAGKWDLRERA